MAPVIILHGPTGAGKSNQAKKLAERNHWAYISSGDLLRASGDKEILQKIEAGELAPSDYIQRLIKEAFGFIPNDQTVVIDGFPRMYSEFEWIDRYLPTVKRRISKVVEVSVSPEVSRERVAYRQRGGDDDSAVDKKLQWYKEEVGPILDEFKKRGQLAVVDGESDDETVYQRVMEAVR